MLNRADVEPLSQIGTDLDVALRKCDMCYKFDLQGRHNNAPWQELEQG